MEGLSAAITKAGNELDNLAAHDCTNIPEILCKFLKDSESILLIGHLKGVVDDTLRYIHSASFIVHADSWDSIDQLDTFNVLRRNKTREKIYELAEDNGLPTAKSHHIHKTYVTCIFPERFTQEEAELIATIYERTLIGSRNFDNLIDGLIYTTARPDEDREFHPKFKSYADLSDALSKTFNINSRYFYFTGDRKTKRDFQSSDFRDYGDGTLETWFPAVQDQNFRRKRDVAVNLKQAVVGTVMGLEPLHYCLVPASDPSIRGTPVEGVLLIWCTTPISLAAYKAAATWIREMSARRHVERARSLNDIRAMTEKELDDFTRQTDGGRAARREAIKRVSDNVCDYICNLTSASSAGVWLLHNTKETIHLYGSKSTPMGNYDGQNRARDIAMSERETSAIAFSFSYASDEREGSLYIPDVNDIPALYRNKGLLSTLIVRTRTRCEAVIRLRRGGLLAGALNVESPVQDSLGHDRSFLESCGEILSAFLSRLETSSDRVGLTDFADTQIAIHAVKGQLSKWKKDDQAGAVKILTQLKENAAGEDRPRKRTAQTVNSFNKAWKDRVRAHLAGVASSARVGDVLHGVVPRGFPASDLPGLEVIMDSIWRNLEEYTSLQDNAVEFQSTSQPFARHNILQITWRSPRSLQRSLNTEHLFLQPRLGGPTLHFGFFLIGVHARLMGGHVEFSTETPPASGFTVRIFIPY